MPKKYELTVSVLTNAADGLSHTWLDAALATCQRHHLKPTAYEVHEALADLLERVGDSAGALTHFRRFHVLEREVQSEAASVTVAAAPNSRARAGQSAA